MVDHSHWFGGSPCAPEPSPRCWTFVLRAQDGWRSRAIEDEGLVARIRGLHTANYFAYTSIHRLSRRGVRLRGGLLWVGQPRPWSRGVSGLGGVEGPCGAWRAVRETIFGQARGGAAARNASWSLGGWSGGGGERSDAGERFDECVLPGPAGGEVQREAPGGAGEASG